MERPDIFTFNNFRDFLQEMYEYKHSQNKSFTKAKICRDMGLMNTRSYFQNILNGKFLTSTKANLIAQSFDLSSPETKFFKVLVNFNQAFDDPDERDLCLDQMLSMKKASGYEVVEEQYEYYRKWHHSVIRMLLSIVDVSDDYTLLQKRLSQEISMKDIENSIALLKELKLITKNAAGYYKPSDTMISTPEYCEDELVKSYQVESLKQAQISILSDDDIPKTTITKMLSFSDEGLTKVTGAINRFSNEINVIVANDQKQEDRIYQMVVTLFPFSKGN